MDLAGVLEEAAPAEARPAEAAEEAAVAARAEGAQEAAGAKGEVVSGAGAATRNRDSEQVD